MFPHTFTTPLTVNAEIKRIQTFDDDFMIENNYVDHFQLNLLFNEKETNFFLGACHFSNFVENFTE